jgi:hypothetical protein
VLMGTCSGEAVEGGVGGSWEGWVKGLLLFLVHLGLIKLILLYWGNGVWLIFFGVQSIQWR